MVKKCYNYSDLVKDEEISKFIKQIEKEHTNICNKIIKKIEQ